MKERGSYLPLIPSSCMTPSVSLQSTHKYCSNRIKFRYGLTHLCFDTPIRASIYV